MRFFHVYNLVAILLGSKHSSGSSDSGFEVPYIRNAETALHGHGLIIRVQ